MGLRHLEFKCCSGGAVLEKSATFVAAAFLEQLVHGHSDAEIREGFACRTVGSIDLAIADRDDGHPMSIREQSCTPALERVTSMHEPPRWLPSRSARLHRLRTTGLRLHSLPLPDHRPGP